MNNDLWGNPVKEERKGLDRRAQKRAYNKTHRDQINARKRAYYLENREKMVARQKAYNEKNRDQVNARNRANYYKNRDRNLLRRKRHAEKNPLQYRISMLKREYGLSYEQYNKLFDAQNGKCAICATSDFGLRSPAVDHCHNGGHVRGLLCGACNRGLGMFNNDIKRMHKAIKYLSKEMLFNHHGKNK